MAKTTTEKRLDKIEARLDMLESMPDIARNLKVHSLHTKKLQQEHAERDRQAKARDEAAPARARHFDVFVKDRLDMGPGRRVQISFLWDAYRAWCIDRETPIPELERYDESELVQAVRALEGVEDKIVHTYIGGKVPGLEGVAIIEQYRSERDAEQDETVITQTTRTEKPEMMPV